jgi:hypothetical protein
MKAFKYLFITVAMAGMAKGAMTMDFVYDSGTGDTVVTYSGTWDTYTGIQTAGATQSSFVSSDFFFISDGSLYTFTFDDKFTGTTFSWLTATVTSQTGDAFGFDNQFSIYAPNGYVAGNNISGTATFGGTDLAALGLSDGESDTYTSNLGNTVSYTVAAVPEPSAALGAVFGLLLLSFRRRRI